MGMPYEAIWAFFAQTESLASSEALVYRLIFR